jgi:type I restriction enzyme, S subunit
LSSAGFDFAGLERFHTERADSLSSKFGRPGDVVITTKGNSVGRVGWVPTSAPEFVYSPHLTFWRSLDHKVVNQRYLYFWSRSDAFRQQLQEFAFGTDMAPYLSLRDQLRMRIDLPDSATQLAVAEVLGALDDKVTANATITAVTDALSATYYQVAVAAEPTASAPLSSLAEFVNGRAFTKDATGTGRVVVRIAELNSGIGASTVYNDLEVADRHLARPGDLLFAWSGSLTVHRWYRPGAIINQHIFKVLPKNVPMWVVRGALGHKLAEFKAIAADKATTMGHIQRHHLDEPVAVLSHEEIARMNELMSSLWDRALAAEQESLRLIETRDTLLPLLMSGKVRVKDARLAAEKVL